MTSTTTSVYQLCGLRLRSAIELPLGHADPAPVDDDVEIDWGPDVDTSDEAPGDLLASYDVAGSTWYRATQTPEGYRLRFSNCGDFEISPDLAFVRIRRDRAGRFELLPILAAGTMAAFLLGLRGSTVIHASAVALDGSALVFIGHAGRGKSTVAALMCTDRRAALLTDDVLVVESEGHCIGGSTELRLRAAAAPIVDDEPSHRVNTTADDRVAYAPSSVAAGPLPIGGIVLPAPSRAATNLEIQQLPASTALIALLACPRVHGWRVPTVIQRDFSTLSRIVNQVPVFSAVIPWGPPFHPFVAERLGVLIDPAA